MTEIRWMIRTDMPSVLTIEELSYENPWSEEEFIRVLRNRNVIGMSIENNDCVVGYMIYEIHENRLHLLNIAVHPKHRRNGVGKALVEKLQSKLCVERRNRITCEVRETNVDAQLFMRSQGFRAIRVLRDFYDDITEDAYLMQYRVNSDQRALA